MASSHLPTDQQNNDPETRSGAGGLHIALPRIILLTILSYGLYALYWTYITWKQYRDHTGETAYPVWHALAQFVPIYGWFRFYAHVMAYKNLMENQGTQNSLRPVPIMGIVVWATLLTVFINATVPYSLVSTILDLISILMAIVVLCWMQFNINRYWATLYWTSIDSSPARHARIGIGEVLLTIPGVIIWILTILNHLYPGIYSGS